MIKTNQKVNVLYVLIRLKFQRLFLRLIGSLIFNKKLVSPPKNILVLRTCLLGDFLFAVPAINLLRMQYPESKIFFLTTFASNKDTVAGSKKYLDSSQNGLPWFNFIYPSIVNGIFCVNNLSFEELSYFRRKIKSEDIDTTFILPHPGDSPLGLLKKMLLLKALSISKNVFGYSVKADYSFGKKVQYDLGLFTHKVIGPVQAVKEYNKASYLDRDTINFPLDIPEESEKWAKIILNDVKKSTGIVSLAIGSIQTHKRWDKDNFVRLIKKICENYDALFILVGTKNDVEIGEYLEANLSDVSILNLINHTSVQQLAAIFKMSDVLIGNDGGAIQLGAAVSCKTISIISGIEYPNSVDPWGFEDYSVRHDVACSPCYSMTSCPLIHNHCITGISVDKVFNQFLKVAEIIKENKDFQILKVLK